MTIPPYGAGRSHPGRLAARGRRAPAGTAVTAAHDPQIAARCDRLIRLRDGPVVDDIDLSGGYPPGEMLRRIGQLG